MKTKLSILLCLIWTVVFSSAVLFAQAQTEPAKAPEYAPRVVAPDDTDLPTFTRISDDWYMGCQPTTGGIRKLAQMGFKSVVNLISIKEGSMMEAKTIEFYGMKYINLEFTGETLNDELLGRFVDIIENKANLPIFVHCRTGNRMAAMLMIYRVKKQGWKFEDALKEATKLGLTDSPIRDAAFKYLGQAAT